MPCTAASGYASGFSDSSLCAISVPSGRRPTTSVKVPPRSIQKSQSCEVFFDMAPNVQNVLHYVRPIGGKTSLLGSRRGKKGRHEDTICVDGCFHDGGV